MSSEVGSGQVAIFPTFKGFRKAVAGETDSAAKSAGRGFQKGLGGSGLAAGKSAGAGFQSGFKAAGGVKALTSSVSSAAKAVSAARLKEQDTAGRVRVAEASLASARKTGVAGSTRVVAAEEKLASAQRAVAAAQDVTRDSSIRLAAAQKQAADAAVQGNQRSGASVRAFLSSSFRRGANLGVTAGTQVGSGFLGAFKRAVLPLAAVAAGAIGVRAITQGFTKAIRNASDLQQSIGGVEAVFGKSAKTVKAFANVAATSVGLTKNEYATVAAILGSQLKNGGTAVDKIAGKTNKLIRLGADLSATFGGTASDAVDALSSALKGERDPIERYGVSLNQAKIDAEAASLGFKKVNGQLSTQASQAATLSLVYKQTSAAQGQFGTQTDTLAEQQQILHANLVNLSAGFGAIFLPVVTKAAQFLNNTVLPAFQKASPFVSKFLSGFTDRIGASIDRAGAKVKSVFGLFSSLSKTADGITLSGVTGGLGEIFPQLKPILDLFAILAPILKQVVAAVGPQLALAVGQVAPQFGKLATALVPLLPSLVKLITAIIPPLIQLLVLLTPAISYLTTNVLVPLFNSIEAGLNFLQGNTSMADFGAKIVGLGGIFGAINKQTLLFVTSIQLGVKQGVDAIGGFVSSVGTNVQKVIDFFTTIGGKIKDALTGAGKWLVDIGKNIVDGLINGIKGAIGGVTDVVKNIGKTALDGLKGFLGIKSPSTVFEHEVGEQIPAGAARGITRKASLVVDAVKSMVNPSDFANVAFPASSSTASSGSAPAAAGQRQVHFHTHNPVVRDVVRDSREAGQTLAAMLALLPTE